MKQKLSPIPVRRFEMGASGMPTNDDLLAIGFKVVGACASYLRIVGPRGGRPKNVSRRNITAMWDSVRISKGLEPIKKGSVHG